MCLTYSSIMCSRIILLEVSVLPFCIYQINEDEIQLISHMPIQTHGSLNKYQSVSLHALTAHHNLHRVMALG